MLSLNPYQSKSLLQHFPNFELSYETVSHKKVSEPYNMTLAIPYGKKAFLWFTYYENKNACVLMELNKEKKIGKTTLLCQDNIPMQLAYNTLFYGCLWEYEENQRPLFIIEDIVFYHGNPIYKQPTHEKLAFLRLCFQNYGPFFKQYVPVGIAMPMMWTFKENLPLSWQDNIPYQVHHLQHRSLEKIVPYMNVPISKNILAPKNDPVLPSSYFIPPPLPRFDYSKHQYKYPTCFEVCADLQNDIYHLYAFGGKSKRIYCGLAYLPSYNCSVFMNGLFRNIKENRNLDALEESDDEDDFQDVREEKYVDLEKKMILECVFMRKFRKWMPLKAIYNGGRVVHIRSL